MDTQLATRIDSNVKKAIELACKKHGLKLRHFIEEALLDKLEEMMDREEIENLRKEPTTSMEEVVKLLKKDGKL